MRRALACFLCAATTFVFGGLGPHLWLTSRPSLGTRLTDHEFAVESKRRLKCDQDPKLPIKIKFALDQGFPGWRFHKATKDDCEWIKTSIGPYAYPEMIQGDFDGNGDLDYAILIEYYADAYPSTLANPPDVCVVAFLATGSNYVKRVVSHNEGGFLLLMPQGSRDYDYGAQSEFVYPHDTISAGSQKGGMSYLYENGKFRAIVTSD